MARIWIDMDNAPHVVFFKPVIRLLEDEGHSVLITLRDYGYTAGLADRAGFTYEVVGRHPGANTLRKVLSLGARALRLAVWGRRRSVDVAVSHGSRGLVCATWLARIPSVTLFDYEHVSTGLFEKLSTRLLLPEALSGGTWSPKTSFYGGYKEELYLGDLDQMPEKVADLTLPPGRAVVVVRPPATSAHYHDRESEVLFQTLMDRLSDMENVYCVVAPRTARQGDEIRNSLENLLNFHILERPVDGLSLIRMADVVVGGGGTMNREAALLGIPVYSIFTGPLGTIDRQLAQEGRMTIVRTPEDVTRINVVQRDRSDISGLTKRLTARSQGLAHEVVDQILALAEQKRA